MSHRNHGMVRLDDQTQCQKCFITLTEDNMSKSGLHLPLLLQFHEETWKTVWRLRQEKAKDACLSKEICRT